MTFLLALLFALQPTPPATPAPADRVVYYHLCDDDRDLRPFMAARSHAVAPAGGGLSEGALRIEARFGGAADGDKPQDAVAVLWDLPPLAADRVSGRVKMPPSAGKWRVRMALSSAAGDHYVLPTVEATPGPDGWYAYDRRLDDPALVTRPGGGADANLVVPRPDAVDGRPVFVSLTVLLWPEPGSPLATGGGDVWVDDLLVRRDGAAPRGNGR